MHLSLEFIGWSGTRRKLKNGLSVPCRLGPVNDIYHVATGIAKDEKIGIIGITLTNWDLDEPWGIVQHQTLKETQLQWEFQLLFWRVGKGLKNKTLWTVLYPQWHAL